MGYLEKLLPPVHEYDSLERDIRVDVEKGIASEDEREVIVHELEKVNWPHDMAEGMVRKQHPLKYGDDR